MVPRGVYRPGVLRGAGSCLGAHSSGVDLRPGCGVAVGMASMILKR